MRCYFHDQQNSFLDYFSDSIPDGAVIYASDILLQYSEKGGTYTEVPDNLTGNIFLAASKDHKFLLHYKNTALHTFADSRRSSQKYIDSPSSDTTSNMPLPSSNPSDPLHPIYYDRKETFRKNMEV